jgi:hypothetical protein
MAMIVGSRYWAEIAVGILSTTITAAATAAGRDKDVGFMGISRLTGRQLVTNHQLELPTLKE